MSVKRVPIEVSVDPRIELFSIIFRVAGNPEYRRGILSAYVDDADRHFEPFRNYSAILLAQKLRSAHGIDYDAPMSLANHLTSVPELEERIPRPATRRVPHVRGFPASDG